MADSAIQVTFLTSAGPFDITMSIEGARSLVGDGWLVADESGTRPMSDHDLAFVVAASTLAKAREGEDIRIDGPSEANAIRGDIILVVTAKVIDPGKRTGFGTMSTTAR